MDNADPPPPGLGIADYSEAAMDVLAGQHGIVLTAEWRASLVAGGRIARAYAKRVRTPATPPS